jgi:hypothetical protein
MSKEAKRILMKDPSRRTDEEIKHVYSNVSAFSNTGNEWILLT